MGLGVQLAKYFQLQSHYKSSSYFHIIFLPLLISLMSSTSEAASDPVKAANVYETISEAIHEANDAAVNASNAAEQALDEVRHFGSCIPAIFMF